MTPKFMGGTMIGLLATPLKIQMGPLMNGYLNNAEVFIPIPTFKFTGVQELLNKYRERAKGQGVDPFGYNFAPYGYAAGQVLAAAVEGTKSFDHPKIADYIRTHPFDTVAGQIKFGKDGEWAKPRMIVTQWQNIAGNDLGQVTDLKNWVVVWPPEHKTGNLFILSNPQENKTELPAPCAPMSYSLEPASLAENTSCVLIDLNVGLRGLVISWVVVFARIAQSFCRAAVLAS